MTDEMKQPERPIVGTLFGLPMIEVSEEEILANAAAEAARRRDELWREWLDERPPAVREKAEAFSPWDQYRIKSTGQLANLVAYDEAEDGTCDTCTVDAWREELPALTCRRVFGVPFSDLVVVEEGAC